jgi:hypothetical protein
MFVTQIVIGYLCVVLALETDAASGHTLTVAVFVTQTFHRAVVADPAKVTAAAVRVDTRPVHTALVTHRLTLLTPVIMETVGLITPAHTPVSCNHGNSRVNHTASHSCQHRSISN